MESDIATVIALMELVIEDSTVPRNIRRAVEEAKTKLQSPGENATKISSAMYVLDDVSNDINMPSNTRTEIWQIISELESLKEKAK